MSCNEWERGEFTFSVSEFGKFKKTLIEKWNSQLEKDFIILGKIFDDIKAAGKGKRNFDYRGCLNDILRKNDDDSGRHNYYTRTRKKYDFKILDDWQIERALVMDKVVEERHGREIVSYKPGKPHVPKKMDFKPLSVKNTEELSLLEATVRFDVKNRRITWGTCENNHACEYARASFLGTEFFELLKQVVWTRGTGGAISGNDEYNEDSGKEHVGGGGSYLKETLGPKGDAIFKQEHGFAKPNKGFPTRKTYPTHR